jgi:hypothetical protein
MAGGSVDRFSYAPWKPNTKLENNSRGRSYVNPVGRRRERMPDAYADRRALITFDAFAGSRLGAYE